MRRGRGRLDREVPSGTLLVADIDLGMKYKEYNIIEYSMIICVYVYIYIYTHTHTHVLNCMYDLLLMGCLLLLLCYYCLFVVAFLVADVDLGIHSAG